METEIKAITTKEIIALLVTKFPLCFSLEGQAKPLKVGVFQDLAEQLTEEDNVSKTRLRQALRHYTSSWRYLKSIKVGAFRVDLAGEQVAEIDQEQADFAASTLKESQDKFGKKFPKAKETNDKPNVNAKPKHHKAPDEQAAKKQKKFSHVKATTAVKAKEVVQVELKPIEDSAVTVGANVKVKFGNSPIDAVITEVSGNDVHVQLASGMVVKTQVEKIFS